MNQNRRHFIKTLAAASAGAAFVQFADRVAATPALNTTGSSLGGLTVFAILDDCANLAVQGDLVPQEMAEFLLATMNDNTPANASRFGAMVPAREAIVLSALKKQLELRKDSMQAGKTDEDSLDALAAIERKIALLLGWTMAAGIREILLPAYQIPDHLADNQPVEMSIYHDMEMLRQIAGAGHDNKISAADAESLFNQMVPRMIARTHTLTPDYDDGMGWTIRVSHWRDDTLQLMQRYAEAYAAPHPEKIKLYLTDMNFYDADEKLLQLAQTARDNKPVEKVALKNALNSPSSMYAKAVAKGIQGLMTATPHFT